MARPEVHHSLRLLLFGLGICFSLLFLLSLPVMRLSDGTVERRSEVLHGKTNTFFTASYSRFGTRQAYITDYDTVPAASHHGDHVIVYYYTNTKTAGVISLKTLARLPFALGAIGVVFILFGSFLRSRRTAVLSATPALAS